MKTIAVITALIIFVLSLGALAQDTNVSQYKSADKVDNIHKTHDAGIGVLLGVPPLGITGKYWVNENSAFNGAIAFSSNNVAVMFDYLYHFRNAFSQVANPAAANQFVPYLGVGVVPSFGTGSNAIFNTTANDFAFGVRIPIGIEFLPVRAPFGVFGEIDPGVGISQDTFAFLQADLGARYYF